MTPTCPPLIQALMQPARYPHPVAQVERIETHGAWVLLAGEHAYKIKKPVRFSFMDFSTLARRRAACEAEMRVNRRFDPEGHIYLAALPLLGPPEAPRWGDPATDAEQAIEWAVHMRRFDEAGRLDHLCQRGALSAEVLEALAARVAAFQQAAAVPDASSPWGQPEDTLALARDNLDTLQATPGSAAAESDLAALRQWTEAQAEALHPVLLRRRAEGRVREGHGDLHLANLTLINGQAVPFDAIEFNDALRWIDTANDIAFTWMDLLDHGQPGLANRFLSAWLDASGEADAPRVLPYFAVYRALVRAKVAAIRSAQPGADREAALAEARRYVALAVRIAHPPTPQLVVTHGLSGSGKSWAAARWLRQEASGRAIRLRSDVERKRLHGLAPLAASGSGVNSGLYSPQAHGQTYQHLRERAEALLRQGWSVVIDAACLRRAERDTFAALASDLGIAWHLIAPQTPLDEMRRRIAARRGDPSEATLAVLEQQLGWVEPLTSAERARVLPD